MGYKGLNSLTRTVCNGGLKIWYIAKDFTIYVVVIDDVGCLLTVLLSVLRIVAGLTQRERCSSWELAACWRPSASAQLASPPGTVLGFRRGAEPLECFAQQVCYLGEGSRKHLQDKWFNYSKAAVTALHLLHLAHWEASVALKDSPWSTLYKSSLTSRAFRVCFFIIYFFSLASDICYSSHFIKKKN